MSKRIMVEHPNGYYGELYGASSLVIFKGSQEVFHTGFRTINTKEELYEMLEEFPRFMELLMKVAEKVEQEGE